ncbi:uncharacterized protein LOC119733328 [Patiria miniata]|uniref:Uncharacterized protein n=1 Tax=Patiria miniata TaxID=46514 RepID=A0A914AH49_PATMI|nr:uncharacterized protein LOC119733328 [Patiria miniata]
MARARRRMPMRIRLKTKDKGLPSKVLQKVELDLTTGVLIFPQWKTQHWFPRLLRLLIATPLVIPKSDNLLYLPHVTEQSRHLQDRLVMCAGLLSGVPSLQEDFHKELLTSYSSLGDQVRKNNTVVHYQNGYNSVVNNMFIHFMPLSTQH